METYKQTEKERTRELIWKHSILSLTNNRRDNRILNPDYMERLWHYSKMQIRKSKRDEAYLFNEEIFQDWTEFADIKYGTKKASELKVALFCGPEPENDVEHLLGLGIRIENIYAFEYDKKTFRCAVDRLHSTYPRLKIFNGKIEDFIGLNSVVFDIVYLDFTRSLLKEFKTVFRLIDSNSLSELSVLAINTTIPEKEDKTIQSFANYFFHTPIFEYGVIHGNDKNEEGLICEGCFSYGILSPKELEPYIERNFETVYSAFQTNFVIAYANLLKPIHSLINKKFLFDRIFYAESVEKLLNAEESLEKWELYFYMIQNPGFHQLIQSVFPDDVFFKTSDKGCKYSRLQASILFDIYKHSILERTTEILSIILQKALPEIDNQLVGKREGLFCDIPMIHLWLELIVNQYGTPYHFNMKNHKRYKYKAKQRDMYLDLFTFDKCGALYDWLPMIEYYGEDLSVLERQIVSRMCVDAIGKHAIFNLPRQYFGAALIGRNERDWSKNFHVPNRVSLS